MARFVMRALVPRRVWRAVLGRFDARYVTRADHRQDVRDSLWEVQSLKREVAALRREVEQLRREAKGQGAGAGGKGAGGKGANGQGANGGGLVSPGAALAAKVEDAHRLATETASAVDHLLQAEVLLWQAVDGLREEGDAGEVAS